MDAVIDSKYPLKGLRGSKRTSTNTLDTIYPIKIPEQQKATTIMYDGKFGMRKNTLDSEASKVSVSTFKRKASVQEKKGKAIADRFRNHSLMIQVQSLNKATSPSHMSRNPTLNEIVVPGNIISMTEALMQHSNPDPNPNRNTIINLKQKNTENMQCFRAPEKSIKFKNRQPQPYSNFVNMPILPLLRKGFISPRYVNASRTSRSNSPKKGRSPP